MSLSLEYLEHFFHGTPAGIALMTSRIISFANSRMADITGYSKKDLMSKHAGVLYPSERESKRMEKFFYPLLRNKGIATIETRWRCKSGEIRDIFLVGVLLDSRSNLQKSDDDKENVLIVVFDISRRKTIEKSLRRDELNPDEALEKMGEGFWDWDIESGDVQFNDTWIKMLAYKRKDIEFHIRTWQNLIHPDDWHYVRKALNDHLWGGAESYAVEYRLKSKSGKWVRVFDYGRVVDEDEQHYPLRFIGTTIDITYLEKSGQKIFTSERQMSEVTRSDSSFSPKVFRKKTLFAKGMEGFFQLLQNPFVSNEERTRYLDLILSAGSRIHELVHNLMNVSRLDSNQSGLEYEKFNVNHLLRDLYNIYLPYKEDNEIHLQLCTPLTDDSSFVYSDRIKLRQVLRYLLDNAFQFTEKGVIEFGYHLLDDKMHFFVKDSGKGIDKDQKNKIFEPFYTSLGNQKSSGAGLGLTVARSLAGLLKGSIWVKSEQGNGSVFYLTIPCITNKQDSRPGMKNHGQKDDQGSKAELTVLIVEDDRSNAFLLSEILKSSEIKRVHINPQIATNGKEAVEFCKNNPVDLVLMDIKLPVMDGLTACRKIKLLKPELPVVAQTGCAYPSDKEDIFAAGFNDYLLKPMGIGLIRKKLKKYLVAGNSNRVFYEN